MPIQGILCNRNAVSWLSSLLSQLKLVAFCSIYICPKYFDIIIVTATHLFHKSQQNTIEKKNKEKSLIFELNCGKRNKQVNLDIVFHLVT